MNDDLERIILLVGLVAWCLAIVAAVAFMTGLASI